MGIHRKTPGLFRIGFGLIIVAAWFIACNSSPSDDLRALAEPSDTEASIRSDVEILSRFAADRLEGIPDPGPFFDSLSSLTIGMRELSGMQQSVERLKTVVYGRWGIAFDSDQDDVQALLPHTIFHRKSGSCLGVSMIFLMLAEQTGTPLHGVVLPGHFFVRYRDGERVQNIEPNREGYAHPDLYYRERYAVSDPPGYYLGDLTRREAVGVLCYNLGNIFRERERPAEALALYRAAVERFDRYAEAWGNLAIILNRQGRNVDARAAMDSAYRRNSALPGIQENRAALALSSGQHKEAIAIYEKMLIEQPGNPEAMLGKVYAFVGLEDMKGADSALDRLKEFHPEYPVPTELRRRLDKGK